MKFITNNSTLLVGYKEKYIDEAVNTEFVVYKLITTYIGRTILTD
jgi:hypothetical protein